MRFLTIYVFIKKSYLLYLLQIRGPFLHINTLLWEGIWGLQAGASNLHEALLQFSEDVNLCPAALQAGHNLTLPTKSKPCSQVSTQSGLGTSKGLCSLS